MIRLSYAPSTITYEHRSGPTDTKVVRWRMDWLRQLLEATNRSQADLAAHLKIAPPRVSEMIRGDRRLQQQEIKPIAEFFGLNAGNITEMLAGDAETIRFSIAHAGNKAAARPRLDPASARGAAPDNAAHVTRVPAPRGEADIPLWASAAAGDEGAMILVPDPIGYLHRSERMLNVRSPFAFNVIGDSMSPAIEHGDQVVVNPAVVARAGHDCVFIHEGAEGMLALVKRLVRPGAEHWKVRQFKPPKDFDISRRKWSRVHPIGEIRKAGVG